MTVKKEKKAKIKSIVPKEQNKHIETEQQDEHFCFFEFRNKPYPVSKIQELSKKLIEWAKKNPDAMSIRKFFLQNDIARRDYYRWVDKYDFMRDAHEQAMYFIADRREDKAIGHNPAVVMPYMAIYDLDYKKFAEWRASLTKKEDDKKQDIHVHIDTMPNSDLVPEKKIEEKKDVKFWD